jgi:nitroimidazol reductase NimA-like FMN-containing flavoprotein (pyridoxamine 5'-phosphate oxidase superfamily)
MTPPKYLYLTTTGHISGNPHEIEIWYVHHGDCYYIISGKREASHWVRNIRANPVISFRLGEHTYPGRACIPEDSELLAAVKAKMEGKHGWSDGLVVEICSESG